MPESPHNPPEPPADAPAKVSAGTDPTDLNPQHVHLSTQPWEGPRVLSFCGRILTDRVPLPTIPEDLAHQELCAECFGLVPPRHPLLALSAELDALRLYRSALNAPRGGGE